MNSVKDILARELNALKNDIEEKMAAEGVKASGRTLASMQVIVSENEGTLFGASYFRQLERGRGPGKVPQNFTDIISDWIRAKGINFNGYTPKGRDGARMTSEQHLKSLSGAIAYTIMRHGTMVYRQGTPKDIYTEAVNAAVERIRDAVGNVIEQRIQTINDNYGAYENNRP